jgi:hypothetical protein
MRLSSIRGPWAIGADETADGVCSIFRVNTGLRGLGPDSGYRTAVDVVFAFEETNNEGMPTPSAVEGLGALEHRITTVLEEADEAVLSAVVTTADRGRTFSFYTTSARGVAETIARALGPYGGPCRSVRSGDDPQWRNYREQLDHALAGESDIHLVRRLQSFGIDPREPRTVEHVLHFDTRDAAVRALTGPLRPFETAGPDELPDGVWSVVVAVEQTIEFAPLAECRRWLKGVCSDFGGSYDGWGTPLDPGSSKTRLPPKDR